MSSGEHRISIIPEVLAELGRLKEGLGKRGISKRSYAQKRGSHVKVRHTKYERQRDHVFDDEIGLFRRSRQSTTSKKYVSPEDRQLRRIYENLGRMEQMLSGGLIAVRNRPLYEDIRVVLEELSEAKMLKKPANGPRLGKYDYEDLHTDEAIISMALYLAAAEGRKIGVATRDYDLKKILIAARVYWNSVEPDGFRGITDGIDENPVVLMRYRKGSNEVLSTGEIYYPSRGAYQVYSDAAKDASLNAKALDISRRVADWRGERAE